MRSPVYEFQAQFLGKVMLNLESATLRKFGQIKEMTLEQYYQFREMPEYMLFDTGSLACCFVCSDYKKIFPIQEFHDFPERLKEITFHQLRQYIHSLQRAETYNSDWCPTLFQSIKVGAFGIVAKRLIDDETLRSTDNILQSDER